MPNLISLRILRDASPRNTPPGDPSGGVVSDLPLASKISAPTEFSSFYTGRV